MSPAPPPVVEPEPIAPPVAEVVQTQPWRWISPRPPGESEVGLPMPVHVVNGQTRVHARVGEAGGVEVEQIHDGRVQWTTIVGAESGAGAAALGWAGDVLVAHYSPIASGTTLTRLERTTGAVVWEVPVTGLGPVEHSRYRSDVQLDLGAGRIWIYGREAQGAYVEARALDDGALVGHSLVESALIDLGWQDFETPRFGRDGFTLPAGWRTSETAPIQLLHGPLDGPQVAVPLPADYGDCNVGHGLVHDGTLYLAHACSIMAGARLHALSMDDWSWRWSVDLRGVGPIAHSAYANRVRIEWSDGRLLVYGDEAMGRYVEAVDPATGRTLVTKRWAAG